MQVQGVIVPKKASGVSENAYIGGSDAHDVRPARATPEVERIARRSRTDDDAPPATITPKTIFLSGSAAASNQVRTRARPFHAFKHQNVVFPPDPPFNQWVVDPSQLVNPERD